MDHQTKNNKLYDRGSVEHIKYFIQKYNIKEGKSKIISNVDYNFLKSNLKLWEVQISKVFGNDKLLKILRIINNIQLKRERRPYIHFQMEQKDKIKYQKGSLNEEDFTDFFSNVNIYISDKYKKLTEEEKKSNVLAYEKEKVLYKTELILIKYILFMAFNAFIKSHDKLINDTADFYLRMEYYIKYLDSGNVDLNMDNVLDKVYEKNSNESFKKEINTIYKNQKEMINEALKLKTQSVVTYYNEEKDNYNKDKNLINKVNERWNDLNEEFKIKYHTEKYK